MASKPKFPEPANKSNTRVPSMYLYASILLNILSLVRSVVGRTSNPLGISKRLPFNEPVIIRMSIFVWLIEIGAQVHRFFFDSTKPHLLE